MNEELKFTDVIEPLKSMIGDQAYELAYKDAVIKALQAQIQQLDEKLKQAQSVHTTPELDDDTIKGSY